LSGSQPWFIADASGVGHGDPVEPLADVGAVHGAHRDIDCPAGETFSRQISAHSVEPTIARRSRNLLSHDDSGPLGTDEAKEVGPQMPRVVGTETAPSRAERLARAGASPEWAVVRPASKSSCNGPEASACEEMSLRVAVEVIGLDILD